MSQDRLRFYPHFNAHPEAIALAKHNRTLTSLDALKIEALKNVTLTSYFDVGR